MYKWNNVKMISCDTTLIIWYWPFLYCILIKQRYLDSLQYFDRGKGWTKILNKIRLHSKTCKILLNRMSSINSKSSSKRRAFEVQHVLGFWEHTYSGVRWGLCSFRWWWKRSMSLERLLDDSQFKMQKLEFFTLKETI